MKYIYIIIYLFVNQIQYYQDDFEFENNNYFNMCFYCLYK